MFKFLKQQINKGQDPVQHVVHLPRESSHPSKRKRTFNHNPFRRPWRLLTPLPSRLRSRSRSRPPQQSESDDSGVEDLLNHGANLSPEEPAGDKDPTEDDQESPGGPDRNLPPSHQARKLKKIAILNKET
jgi:hypothetical protein